MDFQIFILSIHLCIYIRKKYAEYLHGEGGGAPLRRLKGPKDQSRSQLCHTFCTSSSSSKMSSIFSMLEMSSSFSSF